MRTIKELLIIVRDNMETENFNYGICDLVDRLCYNIISIDEYNLIKDYMSMNTPLTTKNIIVRILTWNFSGKLVSPTYWWTDSKKKPRIKWLNRQIKKL